MNLHLDEKPVCPVPEVLKKLSRKNRALIQDNHRRGQRSFILRLDQSKLIDLLAKGADKALEAYQTYLRSRDLPVPLVNLIDSLQASSVTKTIVEAKRHLGELMFSGAHPNLKAIIRDAEGLSVSDVSPESCEKLRLDDQFSALMKDAAYTELEGLIGKIWPRVEASIKSFGPGLIGEVSDEILKPLSKATLAKLDQAKGLDQKALLLKLLTKDFIAYHIEDYIENTKDGQESAKKLQDLIAYGDNEFDVSRLVIRGLRTAVNVMFNTAVLSRRKIITQGPIEQKQAALENFGFVHLLASTNISIFYHMDEILVYDQYPQEYVKFAAEQGLVSVPSPSDSSSGTHNINLGMSARIFNPDRFLVHPKTDRLDIDLSKLTEEERLSLQPDSLIRKCPAIRAGILKPMYKSIVDIAEHYAA